MAASSSTAAVPPDQTGGVTAARLGDEEVDLPEHHVAHDTEEDQRDDQRERLGTLHGRPGLRVAVGVRQSRGSGAARGRDRELAGTVTTCCRCRAGPRGRTDEGVLVPTSPTPRAVPQGAWKVGRSLMKAITAATSPVIRDSTIARLATLSGSTPAAVAESPGATRITKSLESAMP